MDSSSQLNTISSVTSVSSNLSSLIVEIKNDNLPSSDDVTLSPSTSSIPLAPAISISKKRKKDDDEDEDTAKAILKYLKSRDEKEDEFNAKFLDTLNNFWEIFPVKSTLKKRKKDEDEDEDTGKGLLTYLKSRDEKENEFNTKLLDTFNKILEKF